ncbi:hypothetical protein [Rheinheimera maricola]|uniref:Uncharacterized protein n=1 Tax=Rheinheimera maricola TaxID=2793282 RepID=A0ABS7XDY9_9GAMM|nr:hypothetical protein [Rheinheimera maricola]MBZ9613788.1 hypothetical protein [Rheinheimera maricola]
MSGSIENQINNVLTDIFKLKMYPQSLVVHSDFDSAFLLSEYYSAQENYIDHSVFSKLRDLYINEAVEMYSLDAYLKGGIGFEKIYDGYLKSLDVDSVCSNKQSYSFIIKFTADNYIVGLDEEVVIFLSRKKFGFIERLGGKGYFESLFEKQQGIVSTPLDLKTIAHLKEIFYQRT